MNTAMPSDFHTNYFHISDFHSCKNSIEFKPKFNGTTNTFFPAEPWGNRLPDNINILSDITKNFPALDDPTVSTQLQEILHNVHISLQRLKNSIQSSVCLPQISIVQQDDKSASLEWIFQDLRAGFLLAPIRQESCFVMVSGDMSSFKAESRLIDTANYFLIFGLILHVLDQLWKTTPAILLEAFQFPTMYNTESR